MVLDDVHWMTYNAPWICKLHVLQLPSLRLVR